MLGQGSKIESGPDHKVVFFVVVGDEGNSLLPPHFEFFV
jgi:hypothetical protein